MISVSKQKKLVEKGRTCSFSIVEEEKTGNFQLNSRLELALSKKRCYNETKEELRETEVFLFYKR